MDLLRRSTLPCRMHPVAIESTALKTADWQRGQLEITFESGHLYRYFDVPRHIFEGLLHAESKGSYFHGHIRDHYRFRRLR